MHAKHALSLALFAAGVSTSHAFSPTPSAGGSKAVVEKPTTTSRKQFLSAASAILVSSIVGVQPSNAEERTIVGCVRSEKSKVGELSKAANCVSTSNIKQVDLYSPPWTFEVSPDEAFARLKGAIAADSSLAVTEIEEGDKYKYIKVDAGRTFDGKSAVAEVEFIVKDDDKVVLFKSFEKEGGFASDFGAQRNKLEALRKKAEVFGVMGQGLTADSYGDVSKARGGGALGQLKAFYGLQSGAGYENVFAD